MCEQRFDRGESRDTDPDGSRLPSAWKLSVPGDDGLRLEAELRDDVEVRSRAFGERVLPGNGGGGGIVRDVRTSFGMTGDPDSPNAMPIEQTGLQNLHGVGERTHRPRSRAANHEDMIDAGVADEALELFIEMALARQTASGEMGYRLEPFTAKAHGDRDGIREIGAWKKGDVDRAPGRQVLPVVGDFAAAPGVVSVVNPRISSTIRALAGSSARVPTGALSVSMGADRMSPSRDPQRIVERAGVSGIVDAPGFVPGVDYDTGVIGPSGAPQSPLPADPN